MHKAENINDYNFEDFTTHTHTLTPHTHITHTHTRTRVHTHNVNKIQCTLLIGPPNMYLDRSKILIMDLYYKSIQTLLMLLYLNLLNINLS